MSSQSEARVLAHVSQLIDQAKIAQQGGDINAYGSIMSQVQGAIARNPGIKDDVSYYMKSKGFDQSSIAATTGARAVNVGKPYDVVGPQQGASYAPPVTPAAAPANRPSYAPSTAAPATTSEGQGVGQSPNIESAQRDLDVMSGGSAASPQAPTVPGGASGGLTYDQAQLQAGIDQAPSDAYFKGFSGLAGEMFRPDADPTSKQNDAAFTAYLNASKNKEGTPLGDTFMRQVGGDDFAAANMLMRLLGTGNVDAPLSDTDAMYGAQQIMGQLGGGGGGFVNPQKLIDAMYQKVAQIQDPNEQYRYIDYTINALKPYMSNSDWQTLQAKAGRAGEANFMNQIQDPSSHSNADFLGLLKSNRFGY